MLRRLFIFTVLVIPLLMLSGCGQSSGGGGLSQTPSNTADNDAPVLIKNAGSLVGEGSTHTIFAGELSYHDSTQPPSSVRFTVTLPPSDGRLEMISEPGKPTSQFTQGDIDAGRVVYKHERGSAAPDGFEFNVEDGLGNILYGQKFIINVIANVSSLNLAFAGGVVHLSWTNPLNKDFAGVEIRRRDDGHYPITPAVGVLVYKSQSGEQQTDDVVSFDTSNGPLPYYYTAFSYGTNGAYSDGVRAGLYCDPWGGCISVPELRELNRIQSLADISSLRKTLITAIWGVDALPGWLPSTVTTISDARYSRAQNIKQIVVQMDYGLISTMRFYFPFSTNGKLVIYHEGHRGNEDRGVEIIQRLLQEGFHVLQVSMPLTGYNYHPDGRFATHDDFAGLDRPMRFFLEPLSVALNYVTSQQSFNGIYMMGISGGGWTTVVYSALDTRITASYPVAGSYPYYLREQLGGSSFGDYEQVNPEFYQHASYVELYLLGASGRRQIQVYNKFDDCCFGGTYSNTFKDYLLDSVDKIGGSADVVIDDTFVGHRISDFALEKILTDIENN